MLDSLANLAISLGLLKTSPTSINGVHDKPSAPLAKRKRGNEAREQPPTKKIKATPSTSTKPLPAKPAPLPRINKAPAEVCAVLIFGNGDNGELGLGPNKTESLRPRSNPYLNPDDTSKFHVVQLACGGMHTIGLTVDNKIISWGVNDNYALGRDTHWDEKLRDVDAESDEEEAELNPLESTPAEIPPRHFPAGTQFVQVAAGDSCSFALTDTGLLYGWGTFRVKLFLSTKAPWH